MDRWTVCSKAPKNLVDGECDTPLITQGKPATYLSWEDIRLGYETPTMTSLHGAQSFARRGNCSHAASVSRLPSLSLHRNLTLKSCKGYVKVKAISSLLC